MSSSVLSPGGIVAMTTAAADRLIRSGSGDGALLYLHLLRRGGTFDAADVRKALGWPDERVRQAYQALAACSLVRKDADLSPAAAPPEPDSPPEYTAADIAR